MPDGMDKLNTLSMLWLYKGDFLSSELLAENAHLKAWTWVRNRAFETSFWSFWKVVKIWGESSNERSSSNLKFGVNSLCSMEWYRKFETTPLKCNVNLESTLCLKNVNKTWNQTYTGFPTTSYNQNSSLLRCILRSRGNISPTTSSLSYHESLAGASILKHYPSSSCFEAEEHDDQEHHSNETRYISVHLPVIKAFQAVRLVGRTSWLQEWFVYFPHTCRPPVLKRCMTVARELERLLHSKLDCSCKLPKARRGFICPR